MTTTTFQLKLERSRFAEHAKASLAALIPSSWRLAHKPAASISAADSAAREAQAVRAMAQTYAKTDPGFAADLYAAAARHEADRTG